MRLENCGAHTLVPVIEIARRIKGNCITKYVFRPSGSEGYATDNISWWCSGSDGVVRWCCCCRARDTLREPVGSLRSLGSEFGSPAH